jgi:hypothetical protein
MMGIGVILAAVLAFLGVCLVVGWVQSFRERLYVLIVGISLIVLAGAVLAPGVAKVVLLAASGLIFAAGLVLALAESVRNVRLIREQQRALEQQMLAYLDKVRREYEVKKPQGEKQKEPGVDGS